MTFELLSHVTLSSTIAASVTQRAASAQHRLPGWRSAARQTPTVMKILQGIDQAYPAIAARIGRSMLTSHRNSPLDERLTARPPKNAQFQKASASGVSPRQNL